MIQLATFKYSMAKAMKKKTLRHRILKIRKKVIQTNRLDNSHSDQKTSKILKVKVKLMTRNRNKEFHRMTIT